MKVLAISGSLRTGSYNRKLLRIAIRMAESAGAKVTEVDLRELALPIYDKDVELAGMPENVTRFRSAIEAVDVVLIASPEYNYSIPGGLKNALDWASRASNSFKGKFAAIFGASSGQYGTVRMQPDLRKVLGALDVVVLPQPQILVSHATEAFDQDDMLRDQKTIEKMEILIKATLELAKI
jgi:chromate reductase, NAD(P)H dehydrogenase (quinone)